MAASLEPEAAAVILAGGRASRMGGGDKTLLDLNGKPVLAHVIGRLARQIEHIAINANGDTTRFDAFGLPVIPDRNQDFDGPLAGILAGLSWAEANHFDHVLTVAGDTPFFPETLTSALSAQADTGTIVVASSSGRLHPTFALWPTSIRGDIESQLAKGQRRVVDLFARHVTIAVDFADLAYRGGAVDPFFNVNTPDDLAQAQVIAAKLAP